MGRNVFTTIIEDLSSEQKLMFLEEVNKYREAMVHSMSDLLRTPLNSTSNFLTLLNQSKKVCKS